MVSLQPNVLWLFYHGQLFADITWISRFGQFIEWLQSCSLRDGRHPGLYLYTDAMPPVYSRIYYNKAKHGLCLLSSSG